MHPRQRVDLRNCVPPKEGMDVRSALAQDPLRVDQLSWQLDGLHLDASKQRWDKETLDGLISLAEEAGVKQAIEDQFSGATINQTEGRAVLHMALRGQAGGWLSSGWKRGDGRGPGHPWSFARLCR